MLRSSAESHMKRRTVMGKALKRKCPRCGASVGKFCMGAYLIHPERKKRLTLGNGINITGAYRAGKSALEEWSNV